MFDAATDERLRREAMQFLAIHSNDHQDQIDNDQLIEDSAFDGQPFQLTNPGGRGGRKQAVLPTTQSILTRDHPRHQNVRSTTRTNRNLLTAPSARNRSAQ